MLYAFTEQIYLINSKKFLISNTLSMKDFLKIVLGKR